MCRGVAIEPIQEDDEYRSVSQISPMVGWYGLAAAWPSGQRRCSVQDKSTAPNWGDRRRKARTEPEVGSCLMPVSLLCDNLQEDCPGFVKGPWRKGWRQVAQEGPERPPGAEPIQIRPGVQDREN